MLNHSPEINPTWRFRSANICTRTEQTVGEGYRWNHSTWVDPHNETGKCSVRRFYATHSDDDGHWVWPKDPWGPMIRCKRTGSVHWAFNVAFVYDPSVDPMTERPTVKGFCSFVGYALILEHYDAVSWKPVHSYVLSSRNVASAVLRDEVILLGYPF